MKEIWPKKFAKSENKKKEEKKKTKKIKSIEKKSFYFLPFFCSLCIDFYLNKKLWLKIKYFTLGYNMSDRKGI